MKLVLFMVALALVAPLAAEDEPSVPVDSKVIVLKPVKVQGTATSNFSIDVRIIVDAGTKKVYKIVITRVADHSDAAALGLAAGDEIVKIDDVPVAGMDPRIEKDSQIGRIFLNRQPGDPLNLEVVTQRTKQITLHAGDK